MASFTAAGDVSANQHQVSDYLEETNEVTKTFDELSITEQEYFLSRGFGKR